MLGCGDSTSEHTLAVCISRIIDDTTLPLFSVARFAFPGALNISDVAFPNGLKAGAGWLLNSAAGVPKGVFGVVPKLGWLFKVVEEGGKNVEGGESDDCWDAPKMFDEESKPADGAVRNGEKDGAGFIVCACNASWLATIATARAMMNTYRCRADGRLGSKRRCSRRQS